MAEWSLDAVFLASRPGDVDYVTARENGCDGVDVELLACRASAAGRARADRLSAGRCEKR